MELSTGVVEHPRTRPGIARAVVVSLYLTAEELEELEAGARARGWLEPGVDLEPGLLGDLVGQLTRTGLGELLELGRKARKARELEAAGELEVGRGNDRALEALGTFRRALGVHFGG